MRRKSRQFVSSAQFNRFDLTFKQLQHRANKKSVERDLVSPEQVPARLDSHRRKLIEECSEKIAAARSDNAPVIMAFGAHAIKNGLGPVIIKLIEDGWITHLATNGAGIIHDWECAFQGMTGEDVRQAVRAGEFGLWQETGFYINLALNLGAYEGRGYGESVGAFIEREKLAIPAVDALADEVSTSLDEAPSQAAAAAELISIIRQFDLKPGKLEVPHACKQYSVQAAAYRSGIPFTGHPMIGHDIIYCHPMNNGSLLGRAALRDFLSFAESVSRIENGVYLSIGSAVMSPMIFEKSFSMAQNLARRAERLIHRLYIFVVDLAESDWNWAGGEPPENNVAYYQRYNKTFSRMGGTHRYLSVHNRDFLLALYQRLSEKDKWA